MIPVEIPKQVKIVAATKYVESLEMRKLYQEGICDFGENRTDSFLKKYEELKDLNVIWHFIGHLQRNKAKDVLNKIEYLHSLDSYKLALEIEKRRIEPLKCLIEINLSKEDTKSGISYEELDSFIEKILPLEKVKLVGLMTMTPKEATKNQKYEQFKRLKSILDELNLKYHLNMKELSMGMSDDYKEAIKAGATMVRLGRILWTKKN
ncbi:MAG: YggS family pyridoxal phosphate-dependent enzyme [Anaeroplasmataceae bacterium]|nr:YggS family pyridoxal phosphate-dependent enzyme [Anaeroplasmataceae bacterium]